MKRAPFIHKVKTDFRKILCDKFYYKWLEQKKKLGQIEYDLTLSNSRLKKLNIGSFTLLATKEHYKLINVNFKDRKITGTLRPYYNKEYVIVKDDTEKVFTFEEVEFK